MLIVAVGSGVASTLAVFIARRWFSLSLLGPLSELPVIVCAAFCQAIASPLFMQFGLLGLFTLGLFPIWAVFSLAHRTRWERLDGLKFAALQVSLLLVLALLASPLFVVRS